MLACWVALGVLAATPPEPGPPAADESMSEPVVEPLMPDSDGRLGDVVLEAVHDKRVAISLAGEEPVIVGTVLGFDSDNVVLAKDSGEIVMLDRRAIEDIKLDPADVPTPPSPMLPMCYDDDGCEEPRLCIRGSCQIEPGYVDELEEQGRARRSGGRKAMLVGAPLVALGLVMIPVGAVMYRNADEEYWNTCWNGDEAGCSELVKQRERTAAVWGVGTVFLVSGVVSTVLGGIFYGVGNSNLRESKRYRKALEVRTAGSRSGASLLLRGRF